MSIKSSILLCLAYVLIVSTQRHEIIEGRYIGERYIPEHIKQQQQLQQQHQQRQQRQQQQQKQYSNSPTASDSSSSASSGRSYTDEGRGFLDGGTEWLGTQGSDNLMSFGNLIHQLSNTIYTKLIGGSPNDEESTQSRQHEVQQEHGRQLSDKEVGIVKDKNEDDLYYHFYPHNQHLFNLPECATQQVCNAVYKRLNFTQPLCRCPLLSDPCSASYLSNDLHTIVLKMGKKETKAVTLIKTCEHTASVRECRAPRDWSILALQNTRTGKAHYLVICKCPDSAKLEGPLNHDQPTYAQVPGIRVYGMMCIRNDGRRRLGRRDVLQADSDIEFPWSLVQETLRKNRLTEDLLSEDPQQVHISPLLH